MYTSLRYNCIFTHIRISVWHFNLSETLLVPPFKCIWKIRFLCNKIALRARFVSLFCILMYLIVVYADTSISTLMYLDLLVSLSSRLYLFTSYCRQSLCAVERAADAFAVRLVHAVYHLLYAHAEHCARLLQPDQRQSVWAGDNLAAVRSSQTYANNTYYANFNKKSICFSFLFQHRLAKEIQISRTLWTDFQMILKQKN